MRARLRTAAGLAAVLALAPSAGALAQEATTTPGGTARTSLLGAEIEITGLGDLPITRLLEATTFATTDPADADNPIDAPFAATSLIPIRAGETVLGASEARSDGASSNRSDGGTFGDVLGALGVDVAPATTVATATSTTATSAIDSVVADVTALLGTFGLDLDVTGIVSTVTGDGASAVQGLSVAGLSLGLEDLGLGADVLGQLPLDVLLGLLDQIPLDALGSADLATITDVLGGLADLDAALSQLEALVGPFGDATDLLALVGIEALPDVLVLDGLLDELALLEGASLTDLLNGLTALVDDLAAVGCDIDLAGVLDLTALQALLADAQTCVEDALAQEALDLTTAGVPGLEDVAPGDLAETLQALVDDLVAGLPIGVDELDVRLDDVLAVVDQLTTAFGDLDGLLASLQGLLDELAGAPLIEVSAFDIGSRAVATDDVATSEASILCSPITITVLGESVTTPDCSDLLGGLSGITAQLDAALGQVVALLNGLPIEGLVEVGDLRLDVFGNLVESVEEVDGVVTANAGFDLLDLRVPSITLDPSAVTDALGGLGLPDVLGTVTTVVDGILADLQSVEVLAGVSDVIDTVQALSDGLGAPDGLADQLDVLQGIVDGLDLGELGTLTTAVSTPGIRLFIDPVSTATFGVDVADGTATPAPTPAPEPEDDPSLPSTGGGLAAMGLLALAGAAGMRRRRH